ncbi:MAG: homoserine dehydrogenase [Terriglobales bacterium]
MSSHPLPSRPRFRSPGGEHLHSPAKLHASHAPAKVGMIGFGTVGSAVAKILCEREPGRFALTHVCSRSVDRGRAPWLPGEVRWTADADEVLGADVDIVVELVGGLSPAEDWIRRALLSGKSVVTANKQLIAHRGPELLELAQKMGRHLAFGASVAGGVPVVSALQDGLAGDRLTRVRGILNGTCNYILTQIERAGVSFDPAVKEAQRLGFAEADPSEDLDGADAAAKLAILARVGLQQQLRISDVYCRSIRDIEAVDFEYAHDLGATIRQVSRAEVNEGNLFASVQPALVTMTSPLARVQGSQNLVIATGEYGGDTVFSGFGAGGNPTAVAVVSDLAAIVKTNGASYAGSVSPAIPKSVSSDFVSRQYVRFTVKDRPGIIAALAAVFADHEINIDSILQKPGYSKSALPFVIEFDACSAAALENALEQIRPMDFLVQPPLSLPVLAEGA